MHDREPHRQIRTVIFDSEIGLLSIGELMAMPQDRWGLIRDRLTDRHRGKADELIARCTRCDSPVFIRAQAVPGEKESIPLFVHFSGSPPWCEWYQGKNNSPDQAKASQYGGQQESEEHKRLCHLVADLAKQDKRYKHHTVGKYLPPKASSHGRFPDVFVEWNGFAPFVIELQLSHTHQTEISDRYIHYKREDANLIWVLVDFESYRQNLPQNFKDIIRRHRGNAFVLDHAAWKASTVNNTLILSCYMQVEEGTFEHPKQVAIDELTFPDNGLAYFEDRIVEPILNKYRQARGPWFKALRSIDQRWDPFPKQDRYVDQAIQGIADLKPTLRTDHIGRKQFLKLVAAIFSVIGKAKADDHWKNYLDQQPNPTAMLNSFLNNTSNKLMHCASIIECLLEKSPLKDFLKGTVGDHIKRAKDQLGRDIFGQQSWQWKACRRLVPEIFDPIVREELNYYNALPDWAKVD